MHSTPTKWNGKHGNPAANYSKYELQFDLARDVGLDYAPRQLLSSKLKPPST
jgi:hypothetical protein